MNSINNVKQSTAADTPVLFFECILASGDAQRWSTYSVSLGNDVYAPRVLAHNVFDVHLSADDTVDGMSQVSLTLANADSALSEINRAIGFKGGQLTVHFAFVDLTTGQQTTESTILFRGVCADPDEITETQFKLTFASRLSLQRVPIPNVRIQRLCPWTFPSTLTQRQQAVSGGAEGYYSNYYSCGYSADVPGGVGNLINGVAATSCDGTSASCQARGMYSQDSSGNATARFGALDFVPASILVRTAGAKTSHMAAVLTNAAKYNDPAPLVYGTGWLRAPIIFARNDGILTHVDVLLSAGQISDVLKVVVNDVEIPKAVPGTDMTGTGWYQLVTSGARNGGFDPSFNGQNGNPLGDPYGSLAVLTVTVPNQISAGTSLPVVEVLLNGLILQQFDAAGNPIPPTFTNNPAWVILDVLRRAGWHLSEINLASFVQTAEFCSTLISITDANGTSTYIPRYQTNLVLPSRQSAAAIVRGVRVASGLLLRYGANGLLELLPESSLSSQQPAQMDGSNSTEQLNGGWPAYEFSDSSGPFSGIARMQDDSSSVRIVTRKFVELSNRLTVEFQDEANEYQQDSCSVVDSEDAALMGCEVSSQSAALGLPNLNQASRILTRQLRKSLAGNTYIEWLTSFRALKIRPGDIVTFTYLKEGLQRQPVRVLKLSPARNFETVSVLAQWHDDSWYMDESNSSTGNRSTGAAVGVPRPVVGLVPTPGTLPFFEQFDLALSDSLQSLSDGTAIDSVTVGFAIPKTTVSTSPLVPLVNLTPSYSQTGGSLPGGFQCYYAVSCVDSAGAEGALSFTIPASIPAGTNTNTATLNKLSFPQSAAAFNVYRGTTPQTLLQIASAVPLSATYTDTGVSAKPVPPPDSSFDHVNVYYRSEWAGPFLASSSTGNAISCQDMGAVPGAWAGATIRIIAGTGSGQERTVSGNDATSVSVGSPWIVLPDSSSQFVIVESTWHPVGVTKSVSTAFDVPYRGGSAIHVTARSANVYNAECPAGLCPVTRFDLGVSQTDVGTAGAPSFTLSVPGAGQVTLSQVGFTSTANLASVVSGTLQLVSVNELQPAAVQLSEATDASASSMILNQKWTGYSGQVIQIGSELLTVVGADATGMILTVLRGSLGSAASTHNAGDSVVLLNTSTMVVPFANGFFLNRASMNFVHTILLPDVRVVAAEMFVTNAFGDSQAAQQCYATLPDGGLRTLSGGQFALQVSGPIATQQNAAMPVMIESSHAIRDVRAIAGTAPSGYNLSIDLLQNGTKLTTLLIPDGSTTSNVVDGVTLASLAGGELLNMNVSLQLTATDAGLAAPGRDLTVTVRL